MAAGREPRERHRRSRRRRVGGAAVQRGDVRSDIPYDHRGMLQFSGGITSARGHAGDNAGRTALVALLNRLETSHPRTNVFGCPLFASRTQPLEDVPCMPQNRP